MGTPEILRTMIALTSLCLATACSASEDDDMGGDSSGPSQGDSADSADSAGSADSGGGLSAQCTQLCDHTPTAADLEAQCVPIILSDLGGYPFLEQSCLELSDSFNAGTATVAQCVACYLDADVQASHCATAESMCFL